MVKFLNLICLLFLLHFCVNVNGQDKQQRKNFVLDKSEPTFVQVNKILQYNSNTEIIPDSIAFYPFLIKLKLVKGEDKKVKVEEINASDSLVFKLFPNYNLIKEVNFEKFLIHTDTLEYRIPILIVCEKAAPSQSHLEGLVFPFVDMQTASTAMDKIFKLYFTGSPDNSKMVFQQSLFSITLLRLH